MRRLFITMALLSSTLLAVASDAAEQSLFLQLRSGNIYVAALNELNDATFRGDSLVVNDTLAVALDDIQQMYYGEKPNKLEICWKDELVTWINPYWTLGVTITTNEGNVIVNNPCANQEITTQLSGTCTDGSFTYYGIYKTTIELDGLTLTNAHAGAAIDIECGKRIALEINKETVNTLVDGAGGTHKAALYCKGHLEIDKSGTLNVIGKTGHAISAKEYIKLKKSDGTINIQGAVGDGIHCKQYFLGNGFNVNISSVGDDCIQAELDGEENDEGIADGSLLIMGGTYTLKNATNGSMNGTDVNTAKGLNADGNVYLCGGTIDIAMTGKGGKGIKAEGTYTQGTEEGDGPILTIATSGASYGSTSSGGRPGASSSGSASKAIKAIGAVTLWGGTTCITTKTSGAEGLESKAGIKICGGSHYLKCYDDCLNAAGIIEFAGGNTVCYGYGNDAVDSNYGRKGALTISGGSVFAYSTKGSPEEGLDCDNNSYLVITGGIAISAGAKQGGGGGGWGGWGGWGGNSSSSSSVGSSAQGYYLGSSPSSYNTTSYYTLYNTSGEAICTYKFEATCSNSLGLLTAPTLGKGSITIKSGTSAPTAWTDSVTNAASDIVFYLTPTVTTNTTTATITAK